MKKLNTSNAGRMPLWQADLDWMQRGYTEPMEALIAGLGLPMTHFAIAGCSPYMPDGKHIAMDEGWFCWGGRILPVRRLPSTDITAFDNPMVRLTLVPYVNPQGARSFVCADLTTEEVKNVWQDDYLQPTIVERRGGFTSGVRLGVGAWTLRDIIAHRDGGESEWMPSRRGDLEYKRIGRMVVLKGFCSHIENTMQSADEGFPTPIGGLAVLHAHVAPDDIYICINSQGDLICQSSAETVPLSVNLTGMTYMTVTPYQTSDPNTINDEPAR